jgi:hypothetical protein
VSADRYANLAPGALAAALRSFARRYEAALTQDPARDPDEQAARATARGADVGSVVSSAAATLDELGPALHRVLVSADPAVPASAAGEPAAGAANGGPVLATVGRLGAAASGLADRLEQAPSADLLRTGLTPDGQKVTAIDIARQAVRVVADDLLAVERALGGRDDGDDDDR